MRVLISSYFPLFPLKSFRQGPSPMSHYKIQKITVTMNTTTRIPIVLMSVEETALAVSISVKTVRSLIRQGRLRAVNLGTRMTRIYLQDLLEIAKEQGYQVVLPSSLSLEGNTPKKSQRLKDAETGSVNKLAKCRKTPKAGGIAPDGVTHDTHISLSRELSHWFSSFCVLFFTIPS